MKSIKEMQERSNNFFKILRIKPKKWKMEVVKEWFCDVLGFEQYLPMIQKKKVNGEKLLKYIESKEKMRELGIKKIGHIKLIKQQLTKAMGKSKEMDEEIQFEDEDEKNLSFDKQQYNSPRNKNVISLFPEKKIKDWGSNEISIWLKEGLGLEECISSFKKHSIRGDILLQVKESQLREMGIVSMGQIKRILTSIQELHQSDANNKENSQNLLNKNIDLLSRKSKCHFKNKSLDYSINTKKVKEWDIDNVIGWLHCINLQIYSEQFRDEKIDGSVLLSINQEDIEDMGIKALGHKKKFMIEIEKLKSIF